MVDTEYRRVRMTVAGNADRSTVAWDRDEVGLWYGAWSADEWAWAVEVSASDPWALLKDLPHQVALRWLSAPDLGVVRRFVSLSPSDWVVLYLRDRGELGLARLDQPLLSNDSHPLNEAYPKAGSREIFKFRRIIEKKSFRIARLPDAYRLIPAQGRQGNVHLFHGMRPHVRLLAECQDETAVLTILNAMSFDQLIDFLGAAAWESVCTAYLILEYGFVPTGLQTGSTLSTLDIIGRRMSDGLKILAQCKKNSYPVLLEADFIAAVGDVAGPYLAFYFAFTGTVGAAPANVVVISRAEILAWVETSHGRTYRSFLQGQ